MTELTEAGCKAFSQADAPLTDTRVLMRAMQYAATFGYRVWLRPQDAHLAEDGVAHDGEVATRLGLPAIPVVAETIALATMLQLARETGASLHVCRISSAAGVDMVRAGQGAGPAGDLRRVHEPRAPDRNGHRLFRRQLPSGAAAAQPARPRRAARRVASTAPSTRSVPTIRRWTRTPSNCRSPKPRPARPGWSCCCRWRSNGDGNRGLRCGERWRAVTIKPAQHARACKMGRSSVGDTPTSACSIPSRPWRVRTRGAEEPGQEHAVQRPRAHGRVGAHTIVGGRTVHARLKASTTFLWRSPCQSPAGFSGLPRFAEIHPNTSRPPSSNCSPKRAPRSSGWLRSDAPPTWENFVEPLDDANEQLSRAWGQVGASQRGDEQRPSLREAYNANLPKVTQYYAELAQNQRAVRQNTRRSRDSARLRALSAQRSKSHVENELRDFRLGGAELPPTKKARFLRDPGRARRAVLALPDNLLDATNDFALLSWRRGGACRHSRRRAPGGARGGRARTASEGWKFTLHMPSYMPVMQYADNRGLRERMYRAYTTRA